MLRAFVFMLLGNLVFAATQIIVPDLKVYDEQNNGYEIEQTEDGYHLSIKDNGSYREENAKEISPEELRVDGLYRQSFGQKLQLQVKYVAGLEGYLAKIKVGPEVELNSEPRKPLPPTTLKPSTPPPFKPVTPPRPQPTVPPRPLSQGCLKAVCAG